MCIAGIVATLLLALPGTAAADAPAPAFTDYGAPAADQYGSPTGAGAVSGDHSATPTPASSGQGGAAGEEDEGMSGGDSSRGHSDDAADGTGTRGAVGGEQVGGDVLPLRDATGDGLPFTGFDLALVALVGIVLLAAGAALRLAVRTRAAARRTAA